MARNVHGDLLMGSGRSGLYLRSRREPIQNQSGGTKRRDTANWANSGRFGLIVQLQAKIRNRHRRERSDANVQRLLPVTVATQGTLS